MKLTKKLNTEILKVYNAYWDRYLKGDVKGVASLLAGSYTQVGSAETEVFSTKKGAMRFLHDTINQVAGKLEMRNRHTRLEPQGDLILIHELCDVFVFDGTVWTFYAKFRASTLMQKMQGGWKITHQHSSFPDARTGEGENIATKKIAAENQQLREAVKRRTIELEQKHRELEVESALERIRSVAMGMKQPADMLGICRAISRELESLNVKNIRNVQTAIFYPQRGIYMNYEYYAKHKKTFITETTYGNNRIHNAFAIKMLKGEGEFFATHIKGRKVKDWIAYQKTTNVFIDRYLNTASSLNYYWYSLGSVAMGISSYSPLADNDLDVFKRFRNVFELAYRRYLDIEQALAQALEAKIEASLEKVRAQAMGMRTAQELKGVGEILFRELKSLGFSNLRNTEILINNDVRESILSHYYSDYGVSGTIEVLYNNHPTVKKWASEMRTAGDAFAQVVISAKEIRAWRKYREEIGYLPDPKLNAAKSVYYYSYATGLGALSISSFTPITEGQLDILKRFRNVFGLAYNRYVDVARAEDHARESRIELSLERVRARSMAMHRSDELVEAADVVFQQLKELGIESVRTGIATFDAKQETVTVWSRAHADSQRRILGVVPRKSHPFFAGCFDAWKAKEKFYSQEFTEKEVAEYYRQMSSVLSYPALKSHSPKEIFYTFFFPEGSVNVIRSEKLMVEELGIMERFASVFGQMYRRFLDLQRAEAQAREAHIEASLERVRAAAMSMNKPADLLNVCEVLFKELRAHGFNELRNTMVNIHNDEEESFLNYDYSDEMGRSINPLVYNIHPVIEKQIKQIRSANDAFSETVFAGRELREWKRFRKKIGEKEDPRIKKTKALHYYFYSIGAGSIGISTFNSINQEKLELLKRFRNVFTLSYQRYADIALAEAQAREAQIETALERVRSRTMGMQRSDELKEVIQIVYQQFVHLNIHIEHTGFILDYKARSDYNSWIADHLGTPANVTIPYFDSVYYNLFNEAKKNSRDFFATNLSFEAKNTFYRDLFKHLPGFPEESKDFILSKPALTISTALLDDVALYIENFSGVPYTDEENAILKRFGKVFQQTYTRFLDLQKAEAQAREAQIEAALEKVRGKAMAMHKSNDLSATASAAFRELRKLGVETIRTGVALYSKDRPAPVYYASTTTEHDDALMVTGSPNPSRHPCLAMQYDAWSRQHNYFPVLRGTELELYYNVLSLQPFQIKKGGKPFQHDEYGYYLPFSEGNFYAWSLKPCTENEINILARFRAIVDLTFRRYFDIQKAEAQARESQIEASLERVRSRTLAMQKSDELAETAAVLFRQLIALGIAPNRLYIAIMKDEAGSAEFWITDEDGSKVTSGFAANLHANVSLKKMLTGWHGGKKSITIDMQGTELQEYFQYLNSLNVPFKGGLAQTRRIQYIAYFSRGFIGIASPEDQPEETTILLERFAAVFNLTLTRFNDLKLAEAQAHQARLDLIQLQTEKKRAEDALSELSATQAQLVQQEKLASLGQLTAGIAHEIKNPLNFVNNFSSVSAELIDEVMEEIGKSQLADSRDIPQLLGDIKTNLGKIIEHGTRADSIVKSMLQHSRGGSGKREQTDLNALVKEYVNLAFHGMRAGKMPINVDIALDLDPAAGTLPLVVEDFSRVILNLCQNAFDAMREKLMSGTVNKQSKPYLARLAVRTRREGDNVSIEVEDNGPGIPDSIKDKILQPFFTTKKGTQGTGLGLSITHDIVKAHGGTITIEPMELAGTIFKIGIPQYGS